MGRKQIYKTYEQLLAVNKLRANEYYAKNKDVVNKKRRERYKQLKNQSRLIINE